MILTNYEWFLCVLRPSTSTILRLYYLIYVETLEYTVTKGYRFSRPSRGFTNQTLAGRE
jgi:hypothetical protein